MATDNSETIQTNAAKPKRVKTPTAEVEQHPIADQIAADKHAAANSGASQNEFFGMRVRKARFGGAGEDC